MREKGQTEVAKTLETPVFSRGIGILTEKIEFYRSVADAGIQRKEGFPQALRRSSGISVSMRKSVISAEAESKRKYCFARQIL